MANILPTAIFPNMTSDVTGITIPYTDLAGLTQAEADVGTGDGREVARSLEESIFAAISALGAGVAPEEMTVSKNTTPTTGTNAIRDSYTFTFDVIVDPSTVTLDAEP